ncbi:MAG TPA: hypothetical protein VMW79_03765 [Anaerolineae bacterium]|nr:hypothetical protein [Anaerolineae bacterium]
MGLGVAVGAVGATLGLTAVMPRLQGVLKVFGTPAEECTSEPGGKIRLIDAGAFEGVDACLMFHPWTATQLVGSDLAVAALEISFRGKTAHAAADPWRGANAPDGVLLTYTNINALRQHVKSEVRIHGIVTHGGMPPMLCRIRLLLASQYGRRPGRIWKRWSLVSRTVLGVLPWQRVQKLCWRG